MSIFYENKYPFASNSSPPDTIFPLSSPQDSATILHPPKSSSEPSYSPSTTTSQSPSHQTSPSINITPHNPASPISPGIDSTPIHHLPRPTVSTPHNTPLLRKSSRESKLPVHLNDYVCNHIFLTDLTDFYLALPPKPQVCSFGALSPQN